AEKDFVAAERLCREVLKETPKDRKTLRLLSALLSWKKDYPAATALLQQLAADDPNDAELPVRLAEVMVWSGNYDQALPRLEELLTARFDQPELWRAFVDAAASVPQLTAAQAALAVRIHDKTAANNADPAFLARLAWLLYRAKESTRAGTLLDQALALRP